MAILRQLWRDWRWNERHEREAEWVIQSLDGEKMGMVGLLRNVISRMMLVMFTVELLSVSS